MGESHLGTGDVICKVECERVVRPEDPAGGEIRMSTMVAYTVTHDLPHEKLAAFDRRFDLPRHRERARDKRRTVGYSVRDGQILPGRHASDRVSFAE